MILRLLAALSLFAGPLAAETLRIGTESDFHPYIFIDETGARTGFDADMMAIICEHGAFDCHWIEVPFDQIVSGVAEGRFDISVGGIGSTPERDIHVDWTLPYRVLSTGTSVFAGTDPDLDVTRARIGVQGGTIQENVLLDNGYTATRYPSHSAALDALFAGEIDAVFATPGYFEELVDKGETRLFNLGAIDYPDDGPQIAVSKSSPELRLRLNRIIEDLRRSGALTLIDARWFPQGETSDI